MGGLLCMISACSLRESSKDAASKTLDIVDGISDALKERGKESGENTADGLGEVGKGIGKSVGKLLTENIDTIAQVAGNILAKGSIAAIDGATDVLFPSIDFVDDERSLIPVRKLGLSTENNALWIMVGYQNPKEYSVTITCYDSDSRQTISLTDTLPANAGDCVIHLTKSQVQQIKSAHKRVILMH